jgi:hypothetical protein
MMIFTLLGAEIPVTVTSAELLSVELVIPSKVRVATTLYVPPVSIATGDTVYVDNVAPDIATLFLYHWYDIVPAPESVTGGAGVADTPLTS